MRHLFLLSLLLLLASCAPRTQTVYEPPRFGMVGGVGGSACIEQCDIQRVRCGQDTAAANGSCTTADGAIARGYNGCRAGSAGCVSAPICLADTGTCTAQYNSCYGSCGGLVRTIRTPYFNADAMPTGPIVVPPLPGAGPVVAPRRAVRRRAVTEPREAPVLAAPRVAGPNRDQFIRDENGVERFVPGQPIRLRRAPSGAPASEAY